MSRPPSAALARCVAVAWGVCLGLTPLRTADAQAEHPEQRLGSIVGVAVGEYGKGIDPQGHLIAADELDEAIGFLQDAKPIADRLSGDRAPTIRAELDTLLGACQKHQAPQAVTAIYGRFMQAMGSAGALEMPQGPLNVAAGQAIYTANCASCHGATGDGNGPLAHTLPAATRPPAFAGAAGAREMDNVSPALMFRVISVGVRNTPMPAWASTLSVADRWNLVAFIRTLPTRPQAPAQILAILDSAMAAARAGHIADASDRAFDSYMAFEPLETPARARNPGLVASMERHFADFKGAIRANNLTAALQARDEIQVGLPAIVDLAQPARTNWGAFLQSFLIILREGFEAILVVGAIIAFLLKTGHRERLRDIWLGSLAGLGASALTAVVLATVLRAIPASSEIIEGITLLVAVVVLFSVSYWLISRVEAKHWQKFLQERVSAALQHGGGSALGFVAFLAVYREGAETALFYQALFHEGTHLALPLTLGIIVGGVALAAILTLFYRFGVRIPLRPFFTVTSAFLYYMAFVFAGEGVRELQEGNVIPVTLIPGAPHVDAMGIFPSVQTLAAQLLLVALLIFALAKTFWGGPTRRPASPPSPPSHSSSPPPSPRPARRSRARSA